MNSHQTKVHLWIARHGGYWDKRDMGLRCVEKAGGIARGVRCAPQDLRPMLGDLLFNLFAISNAYGFDAQQLLDDAIARYDNAFTGPITAEEEK